MRNSAARSNLLVPEVREVMDIRQASDYLGISPDTLYKYASEGFVPAFKLGNRWRFKRSRLDEWMDRQSDQHAADSRTRPAPEESPSGRQHRRRTSIACTDLPPARRDIPFRVDHLRRIGQLRRRMTRAGLPGLLVTHLPDLRYLSGFTGSSAALAVTRRAARLFTDGRYTAQAAEEVDGRAGADCCQLACGCRRAVAGRAAGRRVCRIRPGLDHGGRTGALAGRTAVAAAPHAFFPRWPRPLVEPLRWVKDEDELTVMIEAALVGCTLFEHILGFIRPGLAEFEVAAELEHQARLLGAEGMSFETIVASGVRSALPHGRATQAPAAAAGLPDPRLRCYPQGLLLGYDPHRVPWNAQGQRAERVPGGAGSAGGRGGRR